MSKIEQAARAIWEQRRLYALAINGIVLEEWGDGSIPRANGIMEEAAAAIEAMREPTEEMLAEAEKHYTDDWRDRLPAIRAMFMAMIDAALKGMAAKGDPT